MQFVEDGMQVSTSFRNLCPMFVVACLLYGMLNSIPFRFLLPFLFVLSLLLLFSSALYFSSYFYPLLLRTSWYWSPALLNVDLFSDIFDGLLIILSGIFLMMLAGWLLSLWIFGRILLGFMYGLHSPVFR